MMQSLPAAYDIWHSRYNVDSDASSPWHKLVRANLNPVRDLVDKRILEIGCGRGGFSCWLSQYGAGRREIVAADFSAVAIEKAASHAAAKKMDNIRWEIADIQNIPHPSNSFDTVISCETIEHVPNSKVALHEMSRVLKPGGRLFLTCPNYFGVFGLYRAYLRLVGSRYAEEGQPVNNFLLLPLTMRWVRSAGLKIVKVDATGHYLLFPGRAPRETPALNSPRFLTRWIGLHSLIVAVKL